MNEQKDVINERNRERTKMKTGEQRNAENASKRRERARRNEATSLTKMLQPELAPFGIEVFSLMTSAVKSSFYEIATAVVFPSDSVCNVVKEDVEKVLTSEDAFVDHAEASDWGAAVVCGLSLQKPAHWIWRGSRRGKQPGMLKAADVLRLDGPMARCTPISP